MWSVDRFEMDWKEARYQVASGRRDIEKSIRRKEVTWQNANNLVGPGRILIVIKYNHKSILQSIYHKYDVFVSFVWICERGRDVQIKCALTAFRQCWMFECSSCHDIQCLHPTNIHGMKMLRHILTMSISIWFTAKTKIRQKQMRLKFIPVLIPTTYNLCLTHSHVQRIAFASSAQCNITIDNNTNRKQFAQQLYTPISGCRFSTKFHPYVQNAEIKMHTSPSIVSHRETELAAESNRVNNVIHNK